MHITTRRQGTTTSYWVWYFLLQEDQEKILVFDSNFDSGNLQRACVASINQYNLFLNVDTNTRNQAQWFYYSATNIYQNIEVVFNIVNITKPPGTLKNLISPFTFSEIDYEVDHIEWTQDAYNISLYPNGLHGASGIQYYTLSFSYTFKNCFDKVYFAFYKPYGLEKVDKLLSLIIETISADSKITVLPDYELKRTVKQYVMHEMLNKDEMQEHNIPQTSLSNSLIKSND